MRSVTKNPPTTLIEAKTIATNPSHELKVPPVFAERIAPIIEIPEIALQPDISGVCKVGGTFAIISFPTKTAKINIVIKCSIFSLLP